jgi:hypothetical protein
MQAEKYIKPIADKIMIDLKFIQFYVESLHNKSVEEYFHVERSTVSNWIRRGIPNRYLLTFIDMVKSDDIINYSDLNVMVCNQESEVQMVVIKDYIRLSIIEKTSGDDDFIIALLRHVNEHLLVRDFSYVDLFLNVVNPEKHSTRSLLGLLTATLQFKKHLPSRASLFQFVQSMLRRLLSQEEAELVMFGLK